LCSIIKDNKLLTNDKNRTCDFLSDLDLILCNLKDKIFAKKKALPFTDVSTCKYVASSVTLKKVPFIFVAGIFCFAPFSRLKNETDIGTL
jgi:uridine kinase